MPKVNRSLLVFQHECLRCGRIWDSNVAHPKCCPDCRQHNWDKPRIRQTVLQYVDDLVQKPVDHSVQKELPFIGAKCPYCRGTTGFDTFKVVAFCYSCDMCWQLTSLEPLGVLQGIGLR